MALVYFRPSVSASDQRLSYGAIHVAHAGSCKLRTPMCWVVRLSAPAVYVQQDRACIARRSVLRNARRRRNTESLRTNCPSLMSTKPLVGQTLASPRPRMQFKLGDLASRWLAHVDTIRHVPRLLFVLDHHSELAAARVTSPSAGCMGPAHTGQPMSRLKQVTVNNSECCSSVQRGIECCMCSANGKVWFRCRTSPGAVGARVDGHFQT